MSSAGKLQHIRRGNLLKCPQKAALNPFKHKWQSRWFVLFANSEHGRVRIEYYDNEKNCQQEKGRRVIPLSNCVSIKHVRNKEYAYVIEIMIQDKTIQLAASSKEEERAWFRDLCGTVFGNSNLTNIVQVVDKSPTTGLDYHTLEECDLDSDISSPRVLHPVAENVIEDVGSGEEHSIGSSSATLNDSTSVDGTNDFKENGQLPLTSSVASELSSLVSFESGFCDGSSVASTVTEGTSYPVTIRPTLASQKASMTGTYLLQINTMNITLIDIPYQKPVCTWPILYLRRYGRGRTKFSFEASEKCQFGKGVYTFNTLEGDSIFHLVDTYARGISARNQMIKKRTSMPDGFKPLGAQSLDKLTHSEGKILDQLCNGRHNAPPADCNLVDSSPDIVSIGPGDSVSQMGTLRKELQVVEENGHELKIDDNECMTERVLKIERGMSIGSGISLEIAQNNIPQELKKSNNDEPTQSSPGNERSGILDCTFDTENPAHEMKKLNVSTIEEETLAQTLAVEKSAFLREIGNKKIYDGPTRTSTPSEEVTSKKSKQVKRSSSLKLPSSIRRSNSGKDTSIKKSQSVKRSSSFRLRFFKLKTSDEEKIAKGEKRDKEREKEKEKENGREKCLEKEKERSCETSDNDSTQSSSIIHPVIIPPRVEDIDIQIAQRERVKDYLARAIEDDMNNIEPEAFDNVFEDDCSDSEQLETAKRRKWPVRHRSNEMTGNGGEPARRTPFRNSNSFAGYDYRGHAVLSSKERFEKESSDSEVMRKVELYEGLKKQADDNRVSSYTFWRRRLTVSGNGKKASDTSSINSYS